MLQLGLVWGCIGGFDTLSLPHYRAFDIRVCQIPTIAPYNPEGVVVGQYIDMNSCLYPMINTSTNACMCYIRVCNVSKLTENLGARNRKNCIQDLKSSDLEIYRFLRFMEIFKIFEDL